MAIHTEAPFILTSQPACLILRTLRRNPFWLNTHPAEHTPESRTGPAKSRNGLAPVDPLLFGVTLAVLSHNS